MASNTDAIADASAWSATKFRLQLAIVLSASLLVGIANSFKAVHIDDAFYLAIAGQIQSNPLDPFGGTINWQQYPQRIYEVSLSPPLFCYYLAGWQTCFGVSDFAVHLAAIPWIMLASWSIFCLAERFSVSGLFACMCVIAGPAVVVGTNLMLDAPMLALACASVECLLRANDSGKSRWLVFASLLAAAAVLVKYPAVAMSAVYLALSFKARRFRFLWPALAQGVALVAWQLLSGLLYGGGHIEHGLGFLARFSDGITGRVMTRKLTMFALVGMTFPVWILVIARRRWRVLSVALGIVAAVVAYLMLGRQPQLAYDQTVAFMIAAGLGAAGIVGALANLFAKGISSTAVSNHENADAATNPSVEPAEFLSASVAARWMFLPWIAASTALALLLGPFVAVRSFLLIHPPLVILASLRGGDADEKRSFVGLIVQFSASVILSIGLAWADVRWAACYPDAVDQIDRKLKADDAQIFFAGHWGFQHYAEAAGWKAWDARWDTIPANAFLIVPRQADKQRVNLNVQRSLMLVDRIVIPPHPLGLTTWNRELKIRFYGGDFGEIPWGFARRPTEEFLIYRASGAQF